MKKKTKQERLEREGNDYVFKDRERAIRSLVAKNRIGKFTLNERQAFKKQNMTNVGNAKVLQKLNMTLKMDVSEEDR